MTSTQNLSAAIKSIACSEHLSTGGLQAAFEELLSGNAAPEQIGAFLMGLAVRGETGSELLAGAKVLRENARTITLSGDTLDTCGTGGLGWTSLNTSTASAIVLAACGLQVAKHGNRSVPPKTGSADVLEALGVQIELNEAAFQNCITKAGVGFLFARTHVAPVRASLGIRTIFNLLGPLANPARATHQVLGVSEEVWLRPMAEALRDLGVKKAWVVHGCHDGDRTLDELSIAGETKCISVSEGTLESFSVFPEDAGLIRSPLARLIGGSPEQNADAITQVFVGHTSPFLDAILMNSAAGLHLMGRCDTLAAGVDKAREAITSGHAKQTLQTLVSASREQI